MSITSTPGLDNCYDVECDFCGESQQYESDSWSELLETIKIDGWAYHKDSHGNWEHKCPECNDKEKKARDAKKIDWSEL